MKHIDKKLIRKCRKKDRKAQGELYRACFGFLMPVCMRYASCEDDARAYLNMGFYKILTNLDKYNPKAPFDLWCRRVVINSIIDELRKSKKYRHHIELVDEKVKDPDPDLSEAFYEYKEIGPEDVYRYIQSLPPTMGAVFNLYALDGYKHREIADMMGISENTSKWHYAEAKKRLKVLLTRVSNLKKAV